MIYELEAHPWSQKKVYYFTHEPKAHMHSINFTSLSIYLYCICKILNELFKKYI